MKIKEGFLLRQVGENHIVVPVGSQSVDFRCIITLNDTGAFLWEKMQQETDQAALVAALLAEYDVDEVRAAAAVEGFVKKLEDNGFLE